MKDMTISKSMLDMAKAMGGEQAELMEDIDAMRVYAIEKPSSEQLEIVKMIEDEGIDGFDVLIDADEDGEHALIYTQGDGKLIYKMLIIASDKDEVAIVLIEGRIDPNDAEKMKNLSK